MNKLKEVFYTYPEKWHHIRKLAKILKVSPNTIRNQIVSLADSGEIERRDYNNMIEYRANLDSKLFKLHKKLHNILSLYESGLVEALKENYGNCPIVLFGSYSRGEDLSKSDIDIAVLSKKKSKFNVEAYEDKLCRVIALHVFSPNEVSKEFMNNIINGIILEGMLEI
jgi:predicted nucleotidyltransferase